MRKPSTRLTALALVMTLLLTSCGGGGASAATMHLRKTEGTVDVSDGEGKDIAPKEDLGLYSGYQVGTQAESYAWIDLDSVKLTKMDAESEIEIAKEGKKLEINVRSGSLFFNVTEPLADDETMDIVTSTMMVGVRGTCGWVEVPDRGTMKVFLLEGKVRCEVGGEHTNVRAGEMAVLTEDGSITVSAFTASDIPEFVMEEIEDDDDLLELILDDSGIDPTETDPMAAYEELLSTLENVVYSEFVDFEQDGSPELLIVFEYENISPGIEVYRCGPNGPVSLFGRGSSVIDERGTYSLVESNGKLFLRTYIYDYASTSKYDYISDSYYGSVAQSDGDRECWGAVDSFQFQRKRENGKIYNITIHSQEEAGMIYYKRSEDEEEKMAVYSGGDPAELEAAQSKYTHVRDLVTYDGTNVTVIEP